MRKHIFLFFLFFFTIAADAAVHRVGCYNIRYPAAGDSLPGQSWKDRRDSIILMIRDTMNFDVVALQESTQKQHDYLKNKMGDTYTVVMGSYYGAELWYRTSKYTCLDKGVFYLAPNPSKAGKAWDATQTRWTVWAKLQDKVSGEVFVFASTHLDLNPISIREGARVNQEQLLKIAGNNCACMVAGDMNCEQFDHDPHANYGISFGNSRLMSKTEPQGSFYTFASGMKPSKASKQIDFMYVRNVEVESYFVSNSTLGRSCNLMPSDHMPLVCEVTILSPDRKTTHVVKNVDELRVAAKMVQPNDIIYLKDGLYDLGDSTLTIANTCVLEGSENAILTGTTQLMKGERFISLELQGLTIRGASCPDGFYGSLVGLNGKYLKLTDCRIEQNTTEGMALVYAEDCQLDINHCVFSQNQSVNYEGCVSVTGGDLYPTTIKNSSFIGNKAFQGPALYYKSEAKATLSGNSFIDNISDFQGAVTIYAPLNKSTVQLINNTFARNSIDVEAGFLDLALGGSAICQEMSSAGTLSLVHNTIVGNYTSCLMEDGSSSPDFQSGAIQSTSGRLSLCNNIIAGNYSSCAGRGDISIVDPDYVTTSVFNIYSSEDNRNFEACMGDFEAKDFATACNELVKLLGGRVEDGIYIPQVNSYGDYSDVWAISPLTTTYAGEDIVVVTSSDYPYDQAGYLRNALSVPGSMEAGKQPTDLTEVQHAQCTMHNGQKVMINNHIYIYYEEKLYTIFGMPVRL